jgi:membrane protease subunit HflK
MYIETMQSVLSKVDKVIIDKDAKGNGVVPYLPLPEVQKHSKPAKESQP